MPQVQLSPEGQDDFKNLPLLLQQRVRKVVERLKTWPAVSGAKALKHDWKGHYRIRTGDWRIIFREEKPGLLIVRIMHRKDVYED